MEQWKWFYLHPPVLLHICSLIIGLNELNLTITGYVCIGKDKSEGLMLPPFYSYILWQILFQTECNPLLWSEHSHHMRSSKLSKGSALGLDSCPPSGSGIWSAFGEHQQTSFCCSFLLRKFISPVLTLYCRPNQCTGSQDRLGIRFKTPLLLWTKRTP